MLHLLGNQQNGVSAVAPERWSKPTNRLQKSNRRGNSRRTKGVCSHQEGVDSIPVPSCLTRSQQDEDEKIETQGRDEVQTSDSWSNYQSARSTCSSSSSLEQMEATKPTRRAKTPIWRIGQLEEEMDETHELFGAEHWAEQYRALLASRASTHTPYPEIAFSEPLRKTIRKIGRQHSLRRVAKTCPRRPSYSDSETLVGSESPGSPTYCGKYPGGLEAPNNRETRNSHKTMTTHPDDGTGDDADHSTEGNIGLQICFSLLMNELNTALLKQHPQDEDQAFKLQIWLMIEAYETIQSQLRRAMLDPRWFELNEHHIRSTEAVLNQWLEALYSIYNRHQGGGRAALSVN